MNETGFFDSLLRRMLFLPPRASTIAAEIDYLHYLVIACTMAGAIGLTLLGGYFVIKYRARGHLQREDPTAHPRLRTELIVIFGLLGLFCAFWLIGFLQYVRFASVPTQALDIYVTGKQWMWKFAYPDGHNSISTLYVPVARPVRLILTSRDVIHSFFVPEFRVKHDAIPGRYTTLWFTATHPGRYWIFCTEYCGAAHSTMRGQVVALSPEDYARWLAGARFDIQVPAGQMTVGEAAAPANSALEVAGPRQEAVLSVEQFPPAENLDLAEVGERVAAEKGCLRCHSLDGSAHIGPTFAGLYQAEVPLADGRAAVADAAYLTESMMDPGSRLHRGYPPVMPSYQGLLAPAETAALVELIKSLASRPERPEAGQKLMLPPGWVAPAPAGEVGVPRREPPPASGRTRP